MNTAENKNLVLAMVLMLAVWLGFSFFFPPQKEQQPESVQSPPAVASQAQEETIVIEEVAEVETLPVTGETSVSTAVQTSAPAREITVETDKYQAIFTTDGARLISFKLKDYMETAAKDSAPVQMYETGPLRYSTLRTTGAEGFGLSENARFETATASVVNVNNQDHLEISFKHVAANGMQYVKSFKVRGDEYVIDMALELNNASQTPLRGTVNLAMVQRWDESLKADSYSFAGPATLVKDDIDEVDVDDLNEGAVSYGSDSTWTSFQTKYFLSVVVPGANTVERVRIQRKGDAIENVLESSYFTLQVGEKRTLDYFVFIGPKEPAQLTAAGHQLEKIVSFGFFNVLAQPLFLVLTFFYGFLQNYGIAIILLTAVIKIIFWPLTHKSYSSMKSMQKLQPEMAKLREKFKNDKERLNKEMMQLYKTHSVNPLGGCLPMIVQIPVFFALYQVLLNSIALRHAPFAFWLTDLAAKDPYYITPVLMGASMFVQQKMTPTTADPMQAKIFMMMPIVFTFMFLNFPSGLVIYWLVNNLLTILQQYFIHRKAT
jgi:YidC/Oxa1 family membrane protein insertase